MKSNRVLIFGILLLLMTACVSLVPATTPPQLEHTPGVPIVITDDQIDAGWVRLQYPAGWRVVTNVAIEPLRLVIVSPDDATVINVQATQTACASQIIPTPDPVTPERQACITDGNRSLQLSGTYDDAPRTQFDDAFDRIATSIVFDPNS